MSSVAPDSLSLALSLAESLTAYFDAHPEAAIFEGGRLLFALPRARVRVQAQHGRCVLELWDDAQNMVRTVVEVKHVAGDALKVAVRKLGAARPVTLEVMPSSVRRVPATESRAARDKARRAYGRLLERAIARAWPEFEVEALRPAVDLEHSFGPAYVRGALLRGAVAEAVIGVSAAESKEIVHGVLTLAVLWLGYCREHASGRRHFEGVRVVVPATAREVVAARMRWLNAGAAKWRLFTLDERTEELCEVLFAVESEPAGKLPLAFDAAAVMARGREGVERVLALMPESMREAVCVAARTSAEIELGLHGLVFASVKISAARGSFAHELELRVNDMELTEENEASLRAWLAELFAVRDARGSRHHALYRAQAAGWMLSVVREQLAEAVPMLRGEYWYAHLPMLRGRGGVMAALSVDRVGKLTVVVVASDEQLHLPFAVLDWWRAVNAVRGNLQRAGYFAGVELLDVPPRMLVLAPGLLIHPSNEPVMRYFAREVEWELLAVGGQWREQIRVIHKKRSGAIRNM